MFLLHVCTHDTNLQLICMNVILHYLLVIVKHTNIYLNNISKYF